MTPALLAVSLAMSRVDALVAREQGRDARAVDALDRRAATEFGALAPLGWRAAAPLGDAARKPGRAAKSRLFAVEFLAKLRDPAALAPLSDVLLDPDQDPDVRLAAAQGLAALDAPAPAERRSFCALLAQTDLPRPVRDEALLAASRLGCDEPAPLLKIARAGGPRPRGQDALAARRALKALGRARGVPAERGLLELVAYYPPGQDVRTAAIAALAARPADLATVSAAEALPVLREALRSETDIPAAMLGLVALADAQGPEADALLLPLAAHPDAEVLAAAAEALARRRVLKALPALEAAVAGALNDPRYAPRPGRPDPARLLARVEAAVAELKRARGLSR